MIAVIASFLQVFIESVHRLLDRNLVAAELPPVVILVMIGTIVVKVSVWVWCRTIKNTSVEALTQDAENDVSYRSSRKCRKKSNAII